MAALNEIAVHEENAELAARLVDALAGKGLDIRRNITSINGRDGYHRYVVLAAGAVDFTIRSKSCIDYREARYCRYYLPSIVGERRALQALLDEYES